MATTRRLALWAAVCLLSVHMAASEEAKGENIDWSGEEFRDGSCSYKFENCVTGTTCIENEGHTRYRCFCPEGLEGNGYMEDVVGGATGCKEPGLTNEPCTSDDNCHDKATCTPVPGLDRSQCVCAAGYTGKGAAEGGCEDIDECADPKCVEHALCENAPGSYTCKCDSAHNYRGDGFVKCTYLCYSDSDCDKNARCDLDKSECICKQGFVQNGEVCDDKDECSNGVADCSENSDCINIPGGYECQCHTGYYMEDKVCRKYAQNCNEMLQEKKNMNSGRYLVDFDGAGSEEPLEVDCVVEGDIAVTELAPLKSLNSPQTVPQKATEQEVEYPGDPTALIANSPYCSQEVWLQCTKSFDGGMIQWKDVNGNSHRGWGATQPDMCACGQMMTCPNKCNCGFGEEGVDDGFIINKDQLPVSAVIFPESSGKAGTYYVGKLRCGPEPVDLPKNCHEAKFEKQIKKDKPMYIDIDGSGPTEPFLVFCNQDEFSHVGITEIPLDEMEIKRTSADGETIDYVVPGPEVEELIKGSAFCSQRIEYDCSSTSMDLANFAITTSSRTLTYIPGGTSDKPDSCPCGLTNSCEQTSVTCNCQLGGAEDRKDIGLIINKEDLPVLKVKSTSGDNFFKIGPLQCSEKQFGIEPNCEKHRQAGVTDAYSFIIDPDGPSGNDNGNQEPFLVECENDENQGVTVINNNNGDNLDLSTGTVHTINYLEVTTPQVEALKDRSTGCVQEVTFTDCKAIDSSQVKYNGGDSMSDLMSTQCPGATCDCDTPLIVTDKEKIPIISIEGKEAGVTIGPLKCMEIFTDCEAYGTSMKAEGETKLAKDTLTINPIGSESGDPFVVRCNYKETIISKPKAAGKPFLKLPNKKGINETCVSLDYTDEEGNGIGHPQMAALMDTAKKCTQKLTLTCSNAVGTGMVHYKTCGGTELHKFVDAEVDATCSCGVSGTCSGGSDAECNCDTSGDVKVTDENYIFSNDRLPVCEVCMKLEGIEGSGVGVPDSRFIRVDVSDIRCGKRPGVHGNCKKYRQQKEFNDLDSTTYTDVWVSTSDKPIVVGCKLYPTPGFGEMLIRPDNPVYLTKPDEPGNITVIYKGFDITIIKEKMEDANYCTQDLLFFCAEAVPSLSGDYGLYFQGQHLDSSDYEIRDLDEDESNEVCSDDRFKDQCVQCGSSPKRIVLTNMDKIPVTQILLPPNTGATIGVHDTACAYVEKDCDAILKKDKVKSELLFDGTYLVDPDQHGPVRPFQVHCEFNENVGITKLSSDPEEAVGSKHVEGGEDGEEFQFTKKYTTATPDQIHSLVENSEFCWQGVKYECHETPLDSSSGLLDYQGQTLTSFGTADNSSVMGCVCSVLGTCKVEGYTCNCDGKGSMMEQGFVTDKNVLPITGFNGKVAAGGSGTVTVTDVRCAPTPVDIPKNCEEASSWESRFGIDYTVSSEILISPGGGSVRPFHTYCDLTMSPGNPVTIIKPVPTDHKEVVEERVDVSYQGPTNEQLQALISVSKYCYQPVKVDCFAASFMEAGAKFQGLDGIEHSFWGNAGTGTGQEGMCTCGVEELCGGLDSLTQQLATKCNCDIGDNVWRSDAAILDVTETGPITSLLTSDSISGHLNLTVGDVFCSEEPLEFNECAIGFEECDPHAKCEDEKKGYRCLCEEGWQGKIAKGEGNDDPPRANGRQCVDDDECTLTNQCKGYNSDCVNTPGAYHCDCHEGYRHPEGDVFACEDIDECKEKAHNCDDNARCINTDGSFRCRCKKGFRGSGVEGDCYSAAQCNCFGDPHCLSFDGKWNHFQGRCTYVMAENNCGTAPHSDNHFRVSTNNWDRGIKGEGEFSWVKEVIIEVHGKTIVIGQGLWFTVDDTAKSSYRLLSEDKSTELLRVSIIGFRAEVYTNFGLEVLADGKDEVTVITPANMNNSMCGLCGNYDGSPADDWTVGPKCDTKAGSLTPNEVLFGNSWAVNTEDCPVDCDPPPPNITCNIAENQAQQVCNRLFSESSPFQTEGCFDIMRDTDFENFKFSCEYDMCHTDNMQMSLCEIAEAMGTHCLDKLGGVFEWRSEGFCEDVECNENEEFKVCGPELEPTCLSPDPVPIDQCQENCYCMEGFVRQGRECVKEEDCGCMYDDSVMAIGDKLMVENCTKEMVCADHKELHENHHQCEDNHQCVVDNLGVMLCEEITTPEPTTPEPTIPEPTTPEPTIPTTPEPTAPELTTPEPTTPAPATPPPPASCTKSKLIKSTEKNKYEEMEPPHKTTTVNQLTSINFMVRGSNDAYFMLSYDKDSTNADNNNNLYEIVLGSDDNTKSSIRMVKNGADVAVTKSSSHSPLNKKVYQYFWVSWKDGLVEVGPSTEGRENLPAFLSYQNAQPFTINHIFVTKGSSDVIRWKFEFPCYTEPTLPPTTAPTTTPSIPQVSTAPPQPCMEVECLEPNTECVDEICVCEMGYIADCTHCVDINECETPERTCKNLGQKCVNTPGSFYCICEEGFKSVEGFCHDIDECEDPATNCGPHAECHNKLATYECICCMGYAKQGEVCRRDTHLDTVYGAPGQECCACTGGLCDEPVPVCGTDGETHANYAAMVVRGCRDNRTIEVSYRGYCENSCAAVKCDKPHQTCTQDPLTATAQCSCPDCSGQDSANSVPVCATNGRIYASECIFQLSMCLTGRSDVSQESSLTPCGDSNNESPVGPWSEWGPCDNPCGKGNTTRTRELRQSGGDSNYPLQQEAVCYATCEEGPCKNDTCHNPGQVCQASSETDEDTCVCPDCKGRPDSPVCALVGDLVRTYENDCLMKQAACNLTKNYQLLENRACEDHPPNCSLSVNYAILEDKQGCKSTGIENLGFCYGSCPDDHIGECCRPDSPSSVSASKVMLQYDCPGNETKLVEETVITGCRCVAEPQH